MDPAVYLDHNATTPLDPRVLEAMLPWLAEQHGNPSSIHRFGRQVRGAVEEARDQVAALIGADPLEVVFTASGSEANNAVLWDAVQRAGGRGHLVISGLEHPSITALAARLELQGSEISRVPPTSSGVIDVEAMMAEVREETLLVCLMLANNELGTLQPVSEVAARCRERGVRVLCDAVQAVGKVPVAVRELQVDYLSLGAHKFHGPLGGAALWIQDEAPFSSFLVGGSQERRRRAGTENVAAIVGLGRASALAASELGERRRHLASLRDGFEAGLGSIPDAVVHCPSAPRLPHTTHVAFLGVDAEALAIRLDIAGFAISTGAACASGVVEPSRTLLAIGLSPEEALSSVRISFGMPNTSAEVGCFLTALEGSVAELRRLAPAGWGQAS